MRRVLGYLLSLFTAFLVAEWVHVDDAHWSWYTLGSKTPNTDDALALAVFVILSIVLCAIVTLVTEKK
jgi:hypothetical protein